MIITVSLKLTSVTTYSYRFFSCDENLKDLFSYQLSNIQCSIISYSHHAVHYIPMTCFIIGNLYLLITFTHNVHPKLYFKIIFLVVDLGIITLFTVSFTLTLT